MTCSNLLRSRKMRQHLKRKATCLIKTALMLARSLSSGRNRKHPQTFKPRLILGEVGTKAINRQVAKQSRKLRRRRCLNFQQRGRTRHVLTVAMKLKNSSVKSARLWRSWNRESKSLPIIFSRRLLKDDAASTDSARSRNGR